MGTKKDIGKVLEEHLKNFEQEPDSGLWESIASELDDTNDSVIAPMWYYFGGLIAIGIIVSLLLLNTQNSREIPQNTTVVKVPTTLENQDTPKDKSTLLRSEIPNNSTSKPSKNPDNEQVANSGRASKMTSTKNDSLRNKVNSKTKRLNKRASNWTTSSTSSKPSYTSKKYKTDQNTSRNRSSEEEVTLATIQKLINEEKAKRIAQNIEDLAYYKKRIETENEKISKTQQLEATQGIAGKTEVLQKFSEEHIDNNNNQKQQDSSKRPKTEEERTIDREESKKYEIAISPYSSLLYYGSFTKGSSLDDRLVNNPRDAVTTIGFGIRAEFTLTERTKLRVGIGYSPLTYRTNNFQVSVNNGVINIYELAAISGQSLNQGASTSQNTPEAIAFFNSNEIVSIQQDISYLEIPLDAQYMVINKRLGLSLTPGISMFILNKNSLSATATNGGSIFVGEDSNLNDLSLGFNLGVGGHYNLNSQWRLNAEPVFRYQLNPYNNNLSNFKPYYFGVQFGMSYKF